MAKFPDQQNFLSHGAKIGVTMAAHVAGTELASLATLFGLILVGLDRYWTTPYLQVSFSKSNDVMVTREDPCGSSKGVASVT